ncbi:hypothetical protein, partial [Limosilactobacillus antri]|uniref:hypothetical protein n=1 Tax=Limosilactobacillus antri TaxID=227943 RepID=UPI001F57EC33
TFDFGVHLGYKMPQMPDISISLMVTRSISCKIMQQPQFLYQQGVGAINLFCKIIENHQK